MLFLPLAHFITDTRFTDESVFFTVALLVMQHDRAKTVTSEPYPALRQVGYFVVGTDVALFQKKSEKVLRLNGVFLLLQESIDDIEAIAAGIAVNVAEDLIFKFGHGGDNSFQRLIFTAYHKAGNRTSEVRTMSEEQKKQAESLTRELDKLPKEVREGALLYLQGMTAGAKLASEKKEG